MAEESDIEVTLMVTALKNPKKQSCLLSIIAQNPLERASYRRGAAQLVCVLLRTSAGRYVVEWRDTICSLMSDLVEILSHTRDLVGITIYPLKNRVSAFMHVIPKNLSPRNRPKKTASPCLISYDITGPGR